MASQPHGQVSELVALITNAAKTIEAIHTRSSRPLVPSLNDLNPHPLDSTAQSPQLREATQILEAACAQLAATVARPHHTMLNKFMQIYEPACIKVVLDFKISDILQEKPQGMHISEAGRKAGIQHEKLGRILRLLASKHVFREVSKDFFANNRLSIQLLSTNPLSSIGLHFTDENLKASVYLADVLADPHWGPSFSPTHTPFNKSTGQPESLFKWYEGITPEGAMQGARFAVGLIGYNKVTEANRVISEFPWESLSPGATVCDLGGGVGDMLIQLARAYPQLQLKLQDLPDRIQQAQTEVWPNQCPEAIAENRIEFKVIDFLTEPPIPGCDVYYMKHIIHDWPSKECVEILRNICKAVKATSRILIQEYVLQHADCNEDLDSAFQQAPAPLLPNYGVGRIRPYNLDLDMMVMLNSKERKLDEFIAIGEEAGLVFVKLWQVGEMGVVEFMFPHDVPPAVE